MIFQAQVLPKIVSREMAFKAKTEHSYIKEFGYVEQGPLVVPQNTKYFGYECNPPHNSKDGSRHFLKATQSSVPQEFAWVEREKAWERPGGFRLAFTSTYLAKNGWRYAGKSPSKPTLIDHESFDPYGGTWLANYHSDKSRWN